MLMTKAFFSVYGYGGDVVLMPDMVSRTMGFSAAGLNYATLSADLKATYAAQ
jgi:hypothetical protein